MAPTEVFCNNRFRGAVANEFVMTLIVGMLCTDGVVIGADTGLNADARGCDNKTMGLNSASKIEIFDGHIIAAYSGPVGLGQRLFKIIKRQRDLNAFVNSNAQEIVHSVTREALADFRSTGITEFPLAAFLSFPNNDEHKLCEFAFGTLQPEFKHDGNWCWADGTCPDISNVSLFLLKQMIWPPDRPNVRGGIVAALWTLTWANRIFGGEIRAPFEIAILERAAGTLKARKLDAAEIGGHQGTLSQLEEHIRVDVRKLLA
jgi:hypothetical protein